MQLNLRRCLNFVAGPSDPILPTLNWLPGILWPLRGLKISVFTVFMWADRAQVPLVKILDMPVGWRPTGVAGNQNSGGRPRVDVGVQSGQGRKAASCQFR
jgi:hypothetical protein